jgi:hypothetical protein
MSLEHFYMTGAGTWGYLWFWLPLSVLLMWQAYRHLVRRLSQPWLRRALVFVATATVLTAPFWDVIAIGREAARLCKEQAGLHVYRTVSAEGFVGDSAIDFWSKYGFKYVESGGGNMMSRYTFQDGKATHERVQEFIGRYELKKGDNHVAIGKYFARSSEIVVDRQTGEVLGDLVYFAIYPGAFDSVVLHLTGTGSGFSPWHCGNESTKGEDVLRLGGTDVVLATIRPRKNSDGETK